MQNTVVKMEDQSVVYVYRLFNGRVITLDKLISSAELLRIEKVVSHGESEDVRKLSNNS